MKCVTCGKEIEKSSYSNKVLCSSKCFHIDFWNDLIPKKEDPKSVRIDGEHYWLGNNTDRWRGFGGREFKIKFHDGRIVETTNLWHNGTIPESFRDKLPDNAEFI